MIFLYFLLKKNLRVLFLIISSDSSLTGLSSDAILLKLGLLPIGLYLDRCEQISLEWGYASENLKGS